jgi:ABC-2 type transport system ATP-binding protein
MAEVIAASGLRALQGEGPGADRLAAAIEARPGVAMAAPFGTSLHVCGPDRAALWAAIEPWRAAAEWQDAEPTLEDVFIDLMRKAPDNSVLEAG